MKRINNMQSEIINLLIIINELDNNIELLHECNITKNKYPGKQTI